MCTLYGTGFLACDLSPCQDSETSLDGNLKPSYPLSPLFPMLHCQMKVSTSKPNPSTNDTSSVVIILYCGSEGDEEGTKTVGRTILQHMEYRGKCKH